MNADLQFLPPRRLSNDEIVPLPVMLPEPFTSADVGPNDDVLVTRVRDDDGIFRTTEVRLLLAQLDDAARDSSAPRPDRSAESRQFVTTIQALQDELRQLRTQITVTSHTVARVERVYIVVDHADRPVGPNAFPTRVAAGNHMLAETGKYWPDNERDGYKIMPATLTW